MYVKICIYYIPFVFMKIIFFIAYFMVLEFKKIILKVNIREITPLKNQNRLKRGFPIKTFRSGLHMC